MTNDLALTALISRINAVDQPVAFGVDELQAWPSGALACFKNLKILRKTVNANTIECRGCEYSCVMPVVFTEDTKRAFIVCQEPEVQSQMGRIAVELERLVQWQASTKQCARVLASMLGFEGTPEYKPKGASYTLGMRKSAMGRRWLSLFERPLRLDIAGHTILLEELLYFDNDKLTVDEPRIDALLALATANREKAYTPNIIKQAASKLKTQARYQDWRDEYQVLRRKHPGNFDTWYAEKIAKLPIAKGRSPDTIRKQMKT